MKSLTIHASSSRIEDAKNAADLVAKEFLRDSTCLSWFDRTRGICSPKDSMICHREKDYGQYARSLGADLKIDVNSGDVVFFYKDIHDYESSGSKSPRLMVEDVPGYLA